MSKIRLYGETSGYVELEAPGVAGDITLTLPDSAGDLATESYVDSAVALAGGLVAVASVAVTTAETTSSTTDITIPGLTITHTLADAANKVLVIGQVQGAAANTSQYTMTTLYRDSSALVVSTAGSANAHLFLRGGNQAAFPGAMLFLDAPGGVGPFDYTIRFRTTNASIAAFINRKGDDADQGAVSTLTLLEVKV